MHIGRTSPSYSGQIRAAGVAQLARLGVDEYCQLCDCNNLVGHHDPKTDSGEAK
jgi:hypothetical protein